NEGSRLLHPVLGSSSKSQDSSDMPDQEKYGVMIHVEREHQKGCHLPLRNEDYNWTDGTDPKQTQKSQNA
ncbi:hypothetical protein Trydic_g14905, partial [Trypoxylus dichotomus]